MTLPSPRHPAPSRVQGDTKSPVILETSESSFPLKLPYSHTWWGKNEDGLRVRVLPRVIAGVLLSGVILFVGGSMVTSQTITEDRASITAQMSIDHEVMGYETVSSITSRGELREGATASMEGAQLAATQLMEAEGLEISTSSAWTDGDTYQVGFSSTDEPGQLAAECKGDMTNLKCEIL